MKQFLLLILSALIIPCFGQSVKGTIKENNAPIAFANIILHQAKDSSIAKFTYSDDNGQFYFDGVKPDKYFVKITYVGLND
ncbi:MAG: hypothetical protein RIR48_817, partial [Bacteroidota bacterium]